MLSVPFDNIDKICMQLHRYRNIYQNKIVFKKLGEKEKEILADNIKYKDKYKGKRCFILGNGPSVNKINFQELSNELVITVNDMVCHKNFAGLNSDFHFLADPAYLNMSKKKAGEAYLIDKMKCLSESNTVLFSPLSGQAMVKKYGWYKKIDISYFYSKLYFYDNYKEVIDFTKCIPGFQAVIHWCIAFAVYLGCSEIYLLGCDMTDVVCDLSLFVNQKNDLSYAFELPEASDSYEKSLKVSYGLEYTLYVYWKIVRGFSEMHKYCIKNDVKMYNCSEESILQSIPKKKIEDIL